MLTLKSPKNATLAIDLAPMSGAQVLTFRFQSNQVEFLRAHRGSPIVMKPICRSIIKVLEYFQIFQYPLKKEEIERFLDCEPDQDLQGALDELIAEQKIFALGAYYAVVPDSSIVPRREEGNRIAVKKMKKASWMAKLISKFPFVRGVMVSGSLSKGYMEEDSDVDYFIVTKTGRLWVSRTLLILFKKIVLLNSRKYFCVNYFVDEEHLDIEEKNLFTATELVTLLPLYGKQQYDDLVANNQWAWEYYPQHPVQDKSQMFENRMSPLKSLAEFLMSGTFGCKLDAYCMKKTVAFWKRKFPEMEHKTFDLTLKSRPYVSKHHPQNFQQKVLDRLEERMNHYDQQVQEMIRLRSL